MNPSPQFCTRCGATVHYGARFCSKCGAPLDWSAARTTPAVPPTEVVTPQTSSPTHGAEEELIYRPAPPMEKKSPQALLILGVIIAGALVFCLGIGLVWGYNQFFSREETSTPATNVILASETATQTSPPELPNTLTPSPTFSPEPPGKLAQFANISFRYDVSIAQDVFGETVPASTDPSLPYFDLYPEHIRLLFKGYPLYPQAFHEPQLIVFPAIDYAQINPAAPEQIDRLRALIADRTLPPPEETLPFLPIWNAGQLFRSNARFLEFQNGAGIRYLAQYGQAANPINSRELFYTFQGLTHDGRFYISAILPVAHPSLPDPETVVLDDAFYNGYPVYLLDMAAKLGAQPDDSFSPALSLLDALIQSLFIE